MRSLTELSEEPKIWTVPAIIFSNHILKTVLRTYSIFHYRRGGRAVEGDGLENRCRGNSTVSSNLTLSAIFLLTYSAARRSFLDWKHLEEYLYIKIGIHWKSWSPPHFFWFFHCHLLRTNPKSSLTTTSKGTAREKLRLILTRCSN